MLNVWRLTDNHPTAIACSVLWSPFLRLGWNSGKVPHKTQNDPVLTVIIATFEKFIKKKVDKKRPRTILKLENVMTGEKCYPTTSFSDMRLWWQKQWLNNMHWQDKLKITKTNKTKQKNPHLTLSISQGSATNGGSVLMNITGQIDWSSPRSPNTKAARGRRTGNSPLT